MKRHRTLSFILLISLLFATGCWDRTELNDLALYLGWGMDIKNDGTYEASAQIVIPAKASSAAQDGGGGDGKAYFTETATGKDVSDAIQIMQTKISRKLFAGHQKDIFIGEELAKHGVSDVIDEYSRNPDVRLRADVFVVKGGTAKDILKTPQPLEKFPALAALKLHQQIAGLGDVALADFLIDSSTEGNSPTLPVMQMVPNPSQQDQGQENTKNPTEFAYAGRAVFNKDLKLVGYLNTDEAKQAFWVKGQLKFLTVTGFIPQGNGNVSLDLMKLGKTIQPSLRSNQIRISVKLTGQGVIQENNTDLDLTKTKNLQMIENVLDKETQKQVQQVITKVQQEYKADIFGFGEAVHRKYPYQWKSLKKNWEEDFSQANVSVKVNLNVKRVGLTGPSLQLKENQIKK